MNESPPLITYDWCRRTGGALTSAQRRVLLLRSLRTYSSHAVDLVRLAAGQRSTTPVILPVAPRSGLVEAALDAAAEQGPDLAGHGLRTWLFGGALAILDGVPVDPELFCVAAIVHDAGAATTVADQDFTVRSADIALIALRAAGEQDRDRQRIVQDGIVAHATAGVSVLDSPIGAYVQAGAMLDLAGIRLIDLPKDVVDDVFTRHPAGTVKRTITRLIADEARAVPQGRFAQLRRLGLAVAVRTSPSLRGR